MCVPYLLLKASYVYASNMGIYLNKIVVLLFFRTNIKKVSVSQTSF